MNNNENIRYLKTIFDIQISELENVKSRINFNTLQAVNYLFNCKGKLVITGIGKSGIIAKKIAATLVSTGTNSVFMNSAEAIHGDLGIISSSDIVVAISNSGSADEILKIIPSIKKIGAKLVSIIGNLKSPLAIESDYVIDVSVSKEAGPLGIAPTSSSTAALVMGDAIASLFAKLRKFKVSDFALFHPGGRIGKRLLTSVNDVMTKSFPIVKKDDSIEKILIELTQINIGCVCVLENDIMIGIITDGDIRRAIVNKKAFFDLKAKDIMIKNFIYINNNSLAVNAIELMENRTSQISVLPVLDNKKVIGVIRIHDLITIK
jgi:arabinose-5-phosphate isomerase